MLRCPRCGAVQLRKVRRSLLDRLLCLALLRPCKCTSCRSIFYCFWWQARGLPESRHG